MLAWTLTLALFAGATASSSRIVGGEITSIDSFPSIVQIDFSELNSGVWHQNCGGTIITSRHVLSSSQCIGEAYYVHPNVRRIRAGATYRNRGGVIHYLSNVILHPDNIQINFISNVAIARLATSLVFTDAVQRTAIPPLGTVIPDGLPVTQAGWGRTQYFGERSDVLRYVDVQTVNFDICYELYKPAYDWPLISREFICAGLLNVDGKGSCQGDFGGPVYYGNVTIGVIYGGEDCGNSTFPSLNTNVARFTDWIVENAV